MALSSVFLAPNYGSRIDAVGNARNASTNASNQQARNAPLGLTGEAPASQQQSVAFYLSPKVVFDNGSQSTLIVQRDTQTGEITRQVAIDVVA